MFITELMYQWQRKCISNKPKMGQIKVSSLNSVHIIDDTKRNNTDTQLKLGFRNL